DPLTRAEREERLADWLDAAGVDQAWSCAETYVAAGVTPEALESLEDVVPVDARGEALAWLESAIAAAALVRDVENATARIVEIVGAIKSYANMDRAQERVEADVHEGIDSTLAVLGHKLRDARIEVEREYAPDLPRIPAYVAELNQVWSNLFDNAIHALAGGGRIRVRTAVEQRRIRVEVCDNGPGIPQEIQHRIWEPFFTTRDVGAGTGMGLDTVRRIVVERHGGEVHVDSIPGETRFTVWLPLAAPAR
ncbi:MAG TPA: ATP-binding protein, partial [Longimicrobiales bacterium]|nr:ATP-binding protein [Longimicrobiales bacterium]